MANLAGRPNLPSLSSVFVADECTFLLIKVAGSHIPHDPFWWILANLSEW